MTNTDVDDATEEDASLGLSGVAGQTLIITAHTCLCDGGVWMDGLYSTGRNCKLQAIGRIFVFGVASTLPLVLLDQGYPGHLLIRDLSY